MDFMKVFDQTVREMWVFRFLYRSKSVDLWFYIFFRLISIRFQLQKKGGESESCEGP